MKKITVMILLTVYFLSLNVSALSPEFVPGEIIVKFKNNQTARSLDSAQFAQSDDLLLDELKTKYNMKLVRKLSAANDLQAITPRHGITQRNEIRTIENSFKNHGLDRIFLFSAQNNGRDDTVNLLRELNNNPNIQYAEPNYVYRTALIPNDPDFSTLYGLHNTGQTGGTPDADIDAPEAWDTNTGSSDVVVAVIDTGIDYNHEDLAANIWTNPGEIAGNGMDDDGNGFIDDVRGWDFVSDDNDPMDDQGHGTHVAGTIGAVGDNSKGVVGVAWNVKIMPLKFLNSFGSGTTADAISSIQYATLMGANIMSNSWGGDGYSQALKDAIQAADDAGILFVAAAGNNGANADSYPLYPAAYDNANIISVAATDHNDNIASFSNYGATSVDLGAPGVSIFSTVPNGSCKLCSSSGYRYLGGTSMATPHVSGVAALIKSMYSSSSVFQMKSRLLNNVDVLPSLQGITVTDGRVNAFKPLEADSIPPQAITDLMPSASTFDSVTLTWTSTGDDGNIGVASEYDLRYSTSPIDDTNFDSAMRVSSMPEPKAAGSMETFSVVGLAAPSPATYYFALKAMDNLGNYGQISNIAISTVNSQVLLFDDFEAGANGWTISGASSLWHLETAEYNSPMTSMTYNKGAPSYNYDTGAANSGTLTSPPIDLSGINEVILQFYEYYETETGINFDQRFVQISVNESPFSDIIQLSNDPVNTWHSHNINLSAYKGSFIKIRFYFDTIDGISNDYWGWSIDDFAILADNASQTNQSLFKPDLIVANVSTSTQLIAPGRSFSLLNTVKNQGNVGSGGFNVSFHLSLDNSYGGLDDIGFTAYRTVWPLAVGAVSSSSTPLSVPPTTPFGAYYVCAFADSNNSVSELDETNNALCTNTTIQVTGPDLVTTEVTPNNVTARAGSNLSVENTVKNQGAVSAGYSLLAFRLSANVIYGDSDDVVIPSSRFVSSLAAGASSTATTKLLIPTTIKAGNYYVCAKADWSNAVIETVETNNALCSNNTVNVPQPDVIVTGLSTPTEFIAPGSNFNLSISVKNQGGSAASSFNVSFHLSLDNSYGGLDDIGFTAYRTVWPLAVGAVSSSSTPLSVPPTTPFGIYYVCAFADSNNSVSELDETNNALCTNTTIQVTGPDLLMTSVNGPSTAARGGNITVENIVYNQGQVSSRAFYVVIYLSTDALINTSDRFIGYRYVISLQSLSTNAANTTIKIPTNVALGTYYLGAIADSPRNVIETNENNNALLGNTITIN